MLRGLIKKIPGVLSAYETARRLRATPGWYLGAKRWQSAARIANFKDIHKGKRAFILGNGPSLNKTDLTQLRGEITFGSNRIYLLYPQLGFTTTYLTCVNPTVAEQFGAEMGAQPVPKFFGWLCRQHVPFTSDTAFLAPNARQPQFSFTPQHVMWEGATVTFVQMQLAFYMGVSEVILIGVDHNFVAQGKPHEQVTAQTDDENHFAPNYWGKGVRWDLPDLETSEIAYGLAKITYQAYRRRIVDATLGGKLTVFEKVDYESLF